MDSSHDMKYIDFPGLPASAPQGHPHIVDLKDFLDQTKYTKLSIADMVVTILYNYRRTALEAFLDLDRPIFAFLRQESKFGLLDFSIQRRERIVIVGHLKEKEQGGWDDATRYEISNVGKWVPLSWIGYFGNCVVEPKEVEALGLDTIGAVHSRSIWVEDEGARIYSSGVGEG